MVSLIYVYSCDLVFKEVSRMSRSQLNFHLVRFQGYSSFKKVTVGPDPGRSIYIPRSILTKVSTPTIHRTRGPSTEVASNKFGTVWSD